MAHVGVDWGVRFRGIGFHTYSSMSLLSDDEGALDERGARVVDAVENRL